MVWDVASSTPKFTLGTSGAYVAAFSPTGDEVVTGDMQGVVRVFDLSTARRPGRRAPRAQRRDLQRCVQSGREAGGVGLVRQHGPRLGPATGTSFSLRGHAAPVDQAMFDNRGTRVVTIHEDDTVKIWDTTPFHATAVPSPDARLADRRVGSIPAEIGR